YEQRETTLNLPLAAGSGDAEYAEAFATVERALRRFDPELVIVSAGFDAAIGDPLADMELTAGGFRELARRSAALAPRVAAVVEEQQYLELARRQRLRHRVGHALAAAAVPHLLEQPPRREAR